MKLESKFNDKSSWLSIVLIILGWVFSFPILKYGVQARLEYPVDDTSFFKFYIIIVIVSIAHILIKKDVMYVEFNDKEQKIFLAKKNKIGIYKRISLQYDKITSINYNKRIYSFIEIFNQKKRIVSLYKRDFSNEKFLLIREKLENLMLMKYSH